ncbi:Dual specificity protein kinase pom1 [Phlyctema vagabunda]|uniref:Dual specificity protein kinase pom1 n=1 Tax=Phlyctema vagabunda TaxID=108571 RepID=A0ABR4PGZ3_9HELO
MIREQKAPLGSQNEYTHTISNENQNPNPRPHVPSNREPALSASSRNNHSLFSFGGYAAPDDTQNSSSYDFLPSVNFDDLQSSLASASNDFKLIADSGSAAVEGRSMFGENLMAPKMDNSMGEGRAVPGSRAVSGPRPPPARANSNARRQSAATRQPSGPLTMPAASGAMDPLSAPLNMRTRRQNQYPPISGTGANRGPRKSIGPGTVNSDQSAGAPRRRPSVAGRSSAQGTDAGSSRVNTSAGGHHYEGARATTASRAAKTKSLQPPSRQGAVSLTVRTPEHNRSSSYGGKSPGRSNGRGTGTPSSASKRMSVMPGMPPSASHATGLGARTVSPTDARRAKRLSVLHGVPPMPSTPPTPQPEPSTRRASQSPSAGPRKVSTPSSSRTTPDISNRKSYSSGLSVGSNMSFNTARTSTGSLQQRNSQVVSSSRLPTPKPRSSHSSAGNNEEEEVPPVPAIPKAYESPKDSPADPPFFKQKSSITFDTSSINSTSTNSLSGHTSAREATKPEAEASKGRKYGPTGTNTSDHDPTNHTAPIKKKNLQPLRLPPLNLLPLSTPTAAKIAALPDPPVNEGNVTPPPRRANAKTPSTPMTASKTSFFSRNRTEGKNAQNSRAMRSSSSTHHLRSGSSSVLDTSSSESSKPIPLSMNNRNPNPRHTVSPYISSSLPKNSDEYSVAPRSQTSGDFLTDPAADQRSTRLTGPRAQKLVKANKSETPTQLSSPDEPTTPSSTSSSLRRKLSLGWKRSTSKSNINISHAASERGNEYAPPPPKHDQMPPPRLPASATLNNLSTYTVPSPSPSVKSTNYLDSKRRKSSASSLNILSGHDRTHSDSSWGLNKSPKKDHSNDVEKPISTSTAKAATSVMQKMLNPKASANTLRSQEVLRTQDPWTVDLDRDDMSAEEEMKKLGLKRKETEHAARQLDALRRRATPKDRVAPQQALLAANLNIYERGEIVDFREVYFTGTQNAAKHIGELSSENANFGYDDERGDYSIVPGDHLSYRYEIIDVLGKGSFGQVVRCIDHKTGGLVAIKIIRNKKRFHQQALVEVNILQKLREWDPKNRHSMVSFTQSFYFRGHLCISTELLDMNLYEFIKSNAFRGFSLKIVRRFTKQMLSSLLLLKQHKVIHCDLKPENILLAHPLHSEIKVIDFGSSCFENEKVYTYIQSRFYRSPEVILGMTYGMPIDMWSLGCILAELFTGVPIFPGENEQEQLACIMEVFGPPEKHLIEKSTRKKLFFDSLGKPRLTVSSKGRRRRPSSKTLPQVLKCDDDAFIDFLARCLRWDPDRRMKPDEAVRHEFITGQKMPPPGLRMSNRNESPIKRYNTIAATAVTNRPLPEPPATSFKNGAAVRNRDVSGVSPSKSSASHPPITVHGTSRRQSVANGSNTNSTGNKRTSTGLPIAPGASGLPRVTRSTSARQDLASVGATVAMSRRQ